MKAKLTLMLTLTLCLLVAGTAHAQMQSRPPDANGNPQNNWPYQPEAHPADGGFYSGCAQYIVGGSVTPIQGVPVTFSTYTTQGSGYHSHEFDPNNPFRPQALYDAPQSGVTGSNGCYTIPYHFPDFAGWYTMEVVVAGGRLGRNFYAKIRDSAGAELVNYPDNATLNAPQSAHFDGSHSGPTRMVQNSVGIRLSSASSSYRNTTALNGVGLDLIDMVRGSLPHGGIADNEIYGLARWDTSSWEEHDKGVEMDVINPLTHLYTGASGDQTHAVLLIQAMSANQCYVGIHKPGTGSTRMTGPQALDYWLGQGLMHFTCNQAIRINPIPIGQ